MHPQLVPPDSLTGHDEKEINVWKTEFDVVSTLRKAGHEVQPLGVQHELQPIREAVEDWKPDVVFNLLEEFHSDTTYDQNVASYLELLRIPYTGCNPRGLIIARGKALAKKLVAFHRIRTPAFAVMPRGRAVRRTGKLAFPLIVKSATEHASVGIAQASVVDSDEKLVERVGFVHQRLGSDALVEQYVEGREIYVGVLGNDRLTVLPPWELRFGTMQEAANAIATARVKHDIEYQEKWGISEGPATDLPPTVEAALPNICKRIYRTIELDGYARLDFRLAPGGELYFLEANPNPEIAEREEFARSARHAGMSYAELLQKICRLGIQRTGGIAE
jgi:D-alanine-D-alanine ligase